MSYRIGLMVSASVFIAFAGCGPFSSDQKRESLIECSMEARFGLVVRMHDSDGYPIDGATIHATDGDYQEVLVATGNGEYFGAQERMGTYLLLIQIPGRQDTEVGPIIVPRDECHVIPQTRNIEFWSLSKS